MIKCRVTAVPGPADEQPLPAILHGIIVIDRPLRRPVHAVETPAIERQEVGDFGAIGYGPDVHPRFLPVVLSVTDRERPRTAPAPLFRVLPEHDLRPPVLRLAHAVCRRNQQPGLADPGSRDLALTAMARRSDSP